MLRLLNNSWPPQKQSSEVATQNMEHLGINCVDGQPNFMALTNHIRYISLSLVFPKLEHVTMHDTTIHNTVFTIHLLQDTTAIKMK